MKLPYIGDVTKTKLGLAAGGLTLIFSSLGTALQGDPRLETPKSGSLRTLASAIGTPHLNGDGRPEVCAVSASPKQRLCYELDPNSGAVLETYAFNPREPHTHVLGSALRQAVFGELPIEQTELAEKPLATITRVISTSDLGEEAASSLQPLAELGMSSRSYAYHRF